MATRLKTIEYAFPTYVSTVANNTRYDFSAITLYIPETSGRSFKSAIVEVTCDDVITATGGTVTNWLIGMKLGSTAFSDTTSTNDLTHSAENASWRIALDFTSYFNSYFSTGASQTCQVGVLFNQSTGTTTGMTNVAARLILTYEYDDAATTQVFTARIPLDSPASALTTTLAEIGTNQIPAIDGLFADTTATIRDYFFIIEGNTDTSAAVDAQLGMQIDSGAEHLTAAYESALVTARLVRYIWSLTSTYPATSSAHAWKMRTTSTTGAPFNHVRVLLVVTYELDFTSSPTYVLNSIMVPFEITGGWGVNTENDFQRFTRELLIDEPTSIGMIQSGVEIRWNQGAASSSPKVRVGSQSFRTYTFGGALVYGGGQALMHRFDTNAIQGSGLSLARGANTLTIDLAGSTSSVQATNVSGVVYLNYQSAISSQAGGVANHAHTVIHWLDASVSAAATSVRKITPTAIAIPESAYWLTALGFILGIQTASTAVPTSIQLLAEVMSGEQSGDGWQDIYADSIVSDAEAGWYTVYARARDAFKRHANDPDTDRLDIETASRRYMVWAPSTNSYYSLYLLATYHSLVWTWPASGGGTVGGYGGSGSGLTVDVFRSDTDQKLYTGTTGSGGSISISVHDDTKTYYGVCREDATHVGVSDNLTPS